MTSTAGATTPDASPVKLWVMAARPKTLSAAFVPVMVGTAVVYSHGGFAPLVALAALVAAGLIQIGTNFANDYFDFQSGADNEDRLGPTRVTQAGLIAPKAVKRATALTFFLAFLVGLYLVYVGGWPIFVIGVASILSGVAYTGGPYPLGYHGLGDLFVFIFFGLVAVTATYYVQASSWSSEALVASVPIGLLATAILVVNNYRDIETDELAGKRTLAVRIGPRATRWQYGAMLLCAYAVPVAQWGWMGGSVGLLLPLLSFPVAVNLMRRVASAKGAQLNEVLASTAKLLAIFGVLYAGGYLL